MIVLILGLFVFLGSHSISIFADDWRNRIVERFGVNTWRIVYSLLSVAGLVLLIYGYGLARAELVIWYVPPLWLQYVAVALMLAFFPLLLAAYVPGRIQKAAKHPMLVAIKLWATAHLLANGSRADIILFGAFLAWAVIDRISLKRRPERELPGAPAGAYNDIIVVVAGLALYGVFVFGLHAWLMGVPVPWPWR